VKRGALVLLSALLMGLALVGLENLMAPWLRPGSSVFEQALGILVLVGVAMLVYVALTLATGAVDRSLVLKVVRRRTRS
jgi:putative peptidoglycan lipid II flippase